jgi:hypothetical protein
VPSNLRSVHGVSTMSYFQQALLRDVFALLIVAACVLIGITVLLNCKRTFKLRIPSLGLSFIQCIVITALVTAGTFSLSHPARSDFANLFCDPNSDLKSFEEIVSKKQFDRIDWIVTYGSDMWIARLRDGTELQVITSEYSDSNYMLDRCSGAGVTLVAQEVADYIELTRASQINTFAAFLFSVLILSTQGKKRRRIGCGLSHEKTLRTEQSAVESM